MNLQLGCWPGVDDPEFSALLDRRLERLSPGQLAVLREMPARFAAEMLRAHFPEAPPVRIKRVLDQLRNEGRLQTEGRGRGTMWCRSESVDR